MPGIVIHSTKSVYWPIPKNACSTVKKRVCELENLDPGNNVHTAPFEWTTRGNYLEYMNFAIVRNPYARLFSLWQDKFVENVVHGDVPDPNVFGQFGDRFKLGMDFHEFVHTVISIPYREADPHFSLQVFQVPSKCRIAKIEDISPITFGLFESINVTQDNDYKLAYLGTELADIVYQHYQEDFNRFGYSKDIMVKN